MPVLQVIIDESGEIVGTAQVTTGGTGGPERLSVVAGPGQRVIDVNIADELTGLEPAALHAAIKKEHLARGE